VRTPTDISPFTQPQFLRALTDAAAEASAAILALCGDRARDRAKADGSPVTDADHASEAVIMAHLARLMPGIPVVSEEHASWPPAEALRDVFVLVDPLDGTREFIAGRDEYTVNIAVIARGEPVAGVVAAPALHQVWRGARGVGAERLALGSAGEPVRLAPRPWPAGSPVALVSRSHGDAASAAMIDRLPGAIQQPCGSSVKFCRLAEGAADFYPRLAPTCEWDVAAGHAVLAAAGGVVCAPGGAALRYGDAAGTFRLPAFIAWGDRTAAVRLRAFPSPGARP
jgi:3'(2'), 5'-bisphosphate nucleotidase